MKILFVCGTSHHDPHQRTTRPTGGILNSLTLIPEYLAKQGHEVFVNSTYEKDETVNGVHYVKSGQAIGKWDVAIFNRNVLPRELVAQCKEIGAKVVWWLHDIVQTTYLKDDTFKHVDRIVALSDYCKQTYSDFYSIDANKFSVIPNGVDPKLFYPGDPAKRDKNMVMMASALVKGFLPIPTVFDNLKRGNFDIDFRIYSSQKLHSQENSRDQQAFLDNMERQGAHVYSPVSPEVLGHLLRQARCFLMPNGYPEICSNLLLQAQACGCPVVTSNIGSAPEFVENGVILPHGSAAGSDTVFKKIAENSPRDVKSWDQIGAMWNATLQSLGEDK